MVNLSNVGDNELLRLYGALMEELRRRGLVRSSNNPVSDYAEKLVCDKLALSLAGKSSKGYDAIDEKTGTRYQIKARRLTRYNESRQLGVIRNLEQDLFDYLVGVIFDEVFAPIEMWKIPRQVIRKYARFSAHQNGYILLLTGGILEDAAVNQIFGQRHKGKLDGTVEVASKGEKTRTERGESKKQRRHSWTEDDDIVTLYLYKYGDEDLPFSMQDISRKLGMSLSSLRMRIGNFKAVDGKGGLGHYGKVSHQVYGKYNGMSKDRLKSLVLEILQRE